MPAGGKFAKTGCSMLWPGVVGILVAGLVAAVPAEAAAPGGAPLIEAV